MYKIHLCNPQDNWRKLAIIDQKQGDVVEFIKRLKKNEWHQLEIVVTSNFGRFDYIKDNDDWGIRIETGELDLGFVLFKKEVISYNKIKCTLFSATYRLYTGYLDNKDRYYSGSLATFLTQVAPDFVFTPIGSDVNIVTTTGTLDNFEVIKEAIKYKENFEFVEVGLKDNGGTLQPEIVYGKFENIESYYNTSSDERLKPILFTNTTVDPDSTDIGYFEDYTISDQSEPFTLLYAYSQTAEGSNANTRVELRDPNASYINPQFPLVARTSAITNRTTYYIRNPYAVNYTERVKVYTPLDSTNSIDQDGNLEIDDDISPQKLYQMAIAYIQANSGQKVFDINLTLKKVVLPGTLAKIDFKKTYTQPDGTKTVEVLQEDRILDDLEFDLNSIL